MSYEPKPIDTSDVTLAEDLRRLTELLAKNTHDIWAQKRIAGGWYSNKQRVVRKTRPAAPEHSMPLEQREHRY